MARDKAPAASSRGRGKFKVSRGGGRHFSRDIAIDHQMENLGLGASGSEEASSSEEESEPEANTASPYGNVKLGPVEPELTRAERKAMKKAQAGKGKGKGESEEEGSEEEEALPTRDSFGPSRKEKEAAAAVAAKERYEKLHAAGKTDQYKKDMERLQEVRRRREQEAAERKAKDEGE